MFYLVLAIICSALVALIMRVSEKHISGNVSMLVMNYFTCLVVAGVCTIWNHVVASGIKSASMQTVLNCLIPATEGIGFTVGLGLLNGCIYLGAFVLLQLNVKKNGVVLSSTFMKLGLLVPMVLSICFFHEVPQLLEIMGFAIAIAAILVINLEKEQTTAGFKIGLILLLVVGGSADAMSKVFEELGNPVLTEQFLLYTFASALVFCIILMLYKKQCLGAREIFFGCLIGIPNYFSSRFLLLALDDVPAVIAYPTYSVATIVVVSMAGICFFKEHLGKKQWIGVGMILLALVLLNV